MFYKHTRGSKGKGTEADGQTNCMAVFAHRGRMHLVLSFMSRHLVRIANSRHFLLLFVVSSFQKNGSKPESRNSLVSDSPMIRYRFLIFLFLRIEKYRPTELDDLVSHKDIITTSNDWTFVFNFLQLNPIVCSSEIYRWKSHATFAVLRAAGNRKDLHDSSMCS